MNIALIRGPGLTPWEIRIYEPLTPKNDITLFATTYTPQWVPRETPIAVDRCFWPDGYFAKIHSRGAWFFNGICSRILGIDHYMFGLENKLRGFDILHTYETHNTFSYQTFLAKKRYGGKLVVTVAETIPFRGESHPLRRAMKKMVVDGTDAFIAITERTRDMLLKEGIPDDKISVIPLAVDCRLFLPNAGGSNFRAQWNINQKEFVALCVARLVREKGVYDLIEAVKTLKESGMSIRVIFAGDGPERRNIHMKIRRLGIEDRFIFTSHVPYEQLPRLYAASDCLVLPSHPTNWWEEQFGYALVEAMAMERPVISTESGAIPLVLGNAGIIFPPGSVCHLVESIKKLSLHPEERQRLAKDGRKRALELYDTKVVAAKILSLYEKVLRL